MPGESLAACVAAHLGATADLAAEESVREREVRQHGESLRVRDELACALERPTLHEVVPGREQLEPRQSVGREHARLDEPLGREVGGADRADLAGRDERVDRAEALLEGDLGVVAVEEQHVDAVGAESQQRVVDRGADRRRARVRGGRGGAPPWS